ncbi:MAG: PAS domain S-box protein, partial [Candidatus Limnocylindria bacterium]
MPEAEEALRFQAALLDAVGQALVATDTTGVILYWNKAAERMYGWSAAEAIGRPATEITPFEGMAEVQPAVIVGLLREGSWSGDIWATRRDGSRFRAFVTDTPVYGRDGSLVAIIGVSVDVTEREAGEEARLRLAGIVDNSGDAIFGVTLDGLVTSWNPAAQQLFGYTAEEMLGQPIFVITPEDKRQEQAAVRARINAGGAPEHIETTRCRKDGSTIDVAISASASYDSHGNVVGQSVILHDITGRRAAERELIESRQRFEAQFRGNPVPTFIWLRHGDDFVMIDANDAAHTITDGTIRFLFGALATRFFGETPDIVEDMRRCAAGAQPIGRRMPFHMQATNRNFVFVVDYVFLPPDRVMVHTLDVTVQDVSERALRESEERYRGLVETAGEGVWTLDADAITTFVNLRMAEMLGYRVEEMLGTPVFDYMDPESQFIAQEVLGRVDQNAAVQVEFKFTKRDGSHLWALVQTNGLTDAAGRAGALAMITDIT